MKSYKVFYNACYGGFDLDHQTLLELFCHFLPHTEYGKMLWSGCLATLHASQIVSHETVVFPGYTQLYFVKPYSKSDLFIKQTDSGKIYNIVHLPKYLHCFRADQTLIHYLEDANVIGRPIGTGLLHVIHVPTHCSYNVTEYDGLECIHVKIPIRRALNDLLHLVSQTKFVPSEVVTSLHPWTQALLRGEVRLDEGDSDMM